MRSLFDPAALAKSLLGIADDSAKNLADIEAATAGGGEVPSDAIGTLLNFWVR
jgi:hypothetical protein